MNTIRGLIAVLMVALCAGAAAGDPACPVSGRVERLLDLHWRAADLTGDIQTPTPQCQAARRAERRERDELAGLLIRSLRGGSLDEVRRFAAIYREERPGTGAALDPVVEELLRSLVVAAPEVLGEGMSPDAFREEFFPGYGYAEPGYVYRRGRELKREFLQAFWQDEEHVIETQKTFEGTIEFKLAASLAGSPGVANFKQVGEPFRMDVGGEMRLVVKVRFDTREKLTTKARKKYHYVKVWFELLRAEAGILWNGPFSPVGETFLNMKEPTSVAVMVK